MECHASKWHTLQTAQVKLFFSSLLCLTKSLLTLCYDDMFLFRYIQNKQLFWLHLNFLHCEVAIAIEWKRKWSAAELAHKMHAFVVVVCSSFERHFIKYESSLEYNGNIWFRQYWMSKCGYSKKEKKMINKFRKAYLVSMDSFIFWWNQQINRRIRWMPTNRPPTMWRLVQKKRKPIKR